MPEVSDAERLIRSHVLWAMGAGLIPIPILDVAAVTGIQLDMVKGLAHRHGVPYAEQSGKAFVTALTGSTFAAIGASMVKAIPGIGTIFGGLSMSVLSGASTYAVGQVARAHFAANGTLQNLDLDAAKRAYKDAFEEGKTVVREMESEKEEAEDVYRQIEKLGALRDKGYITEEEFEIKKRELLDRL